LIKPLTEELSGKSDQGFPRNTARKYTPKFEKDEKAYDVKDAEIFKDMVQKQTT